MGEIIFMGFGDKDIHIDLTGKTPEQVMTEAKEEMTK